MTTVENFGMIYSTTPSRFDVSDFAGPSKAPMYVSGLLIDIFLDSTIEKLRYLMGVRFIEYKLPVDESVMYIWSFC